MTRRSKLEGLLPDGGGESFKKGPSVWRHDRDERAATKQQLCLSKYELELNLFARNTTILFWMATICLLEAHYRVLKSEKESES